MSTPKKDLKLEAQLNFGIFPGYARFIYQCPYEEVLAIYKKHRLYGHVKAWEETAYCFESYKNFVHRVNIDGVEYVFFVFSEKFLFNDMSYIILAYECTHICQFVLRGMLDRNKEIEAEAYLHSHLMKQCLDAIRGKDK